MFSEETWYLDDGKATGFIKPYAGDKYSFVALLPNEGIEVRDYLAGLSGENFLRIINEAREIAVNANMPKFSCAYTVELNDCLKEMGMPAAFSAAQADFSRLDRSSRAISSSAKCCIRHISPWTNGEPKPAPSPRWKCGRSVYRNQDSHLNRPLSTPSSTTAQTALFLGTVLR